nr:hypothetical protein [Tanacetum cinerariifolium]
MEFIRVQDSAQKDIERAFESYKEECLRRQNSHQVTIVPPLLVHVVNDDNDDEEEISKIDEQEAIESGEGDDEETESDGESEDEETREKEEESLIQFLKLLKKVRMMEMEERMHEEEEVDELYRDIDINQGRGLQVSQDIQDSHESSSTSSFVTSLLNPIINPGMESIFTTGSSSITPIPSPKSTMTPSIITTTTTASQPPIPPTPIPNKPILDSYRESAILKRRREDDDDQEGPSAGSDRGSKRRKEGGEHASANTPSEPATTSAGRSTTRTQSRQMSTSAEDQPIVQTSQHPEWFSQPRKPPTPDRDWNKTLPAPLPLIPDNRGRRVILFAHFINNDLEYLRGGASSRKYTTSVTKTKATDYGHIKWIEDLVPRTMWIQEPLNYDKHAFWGVSHWGRKRQQFYGFAVNQESALDVYSKRRIIAVTDLKIGISKRLRLQDIEDMLLLLVQGKLSNLTIEERFAFNVSLRMFTRSIFIQRRVKDLQLGVESYQKRLNLTKPDKYRFDLKRREAYTAYSYPRGFIYQNKDKKNRLMRIDKLHKFSDGTLNDVRNALDDRLKGIRMQYLPTTI